MAGGSIKDRDAAPFSWTGFYVGAQVGMAWQDNRDSLYRNDGLFYVATDSNPNGLFGGVHAGYNHQFGKIVLGVEADIEARDVDETFVIGAPFANTTAVARSTEAASVRGRLGYVFDRSMVYVTSGVAFAKFENTYRTGTTFFDSVSTRDTGWTIGGGLEHAYAANWTARIEYRYTDYGDRRINLPNFLSPPGYAIDKTTEQSVRVGISYKFH